MKTTLLTLAIFLLFWLLPQYGISSDELPPGEMFMHDYDDSNEITTDADSMLFNHISQYKNIFPGTVALSSETAREHINKKNHLTIDFSFILLSLGWAEKRGTGAKWFYGAGAGIGDGFGFMFLGGKHFSDPSWLSYEERDGYEDKLPFDVFHVKIFSRYQPSKRWHVDLGLHLSAFLHYDSSDDDPGGGECIAAYINPMYGWHHFKIGSRLVFGRFSGCGDEKEFGIKISPLIGRVLFDW